MESTKTEQLFESDWNNTTNSMIKQLENELVHELKKEEDMRLKDLPQQPFDYYLIFDLEGKEEIIEFPVVLFNPKTLKIEAEFHRYVKPCQIPKYRLDRIIKGKYGSFPPDKKTGRSLSEIFFQSAIPFTQVIEEFTLWLNEHLQNKKYAFVTCGDWDIKTQIPRQSNISGIPVPNYFHNWINLKRVFKSFYNYNRDIFGMRSMLNYLKISWDSKFHHSGIDDARNITAVLSTMIQQGCIINFA